MGNNHTNAGSDPNAPWEITPSNAVTPSAPWEITTLTQAVTPMHHGK